MVLPMAIYFHRATVFALPANMLSVPLVGVLAPLAVVTFCAALVSPWLAMVPGAATAASAAWDYRSDWARESDSGGGPAGSGAGVVGGFACGRGLGFLLLGGAEIAGLGLGCGGGCCR